MSSSPAEELPLQSISPPRRQQQQQQQAIKAFPSPWSHTETLHLISAYQHKWYSLNRGQLKATQWEDLSLSLSTLCGFLTPNKTATQCRHKIEKLRKRYRSEKDKPNPSSWEFFDLMHSLHHGPGTAPSLPVSVVQNHPTADLHHRNNHSTNLAPVRRQNELDEDEEDNLINCTRSIPAARYHPNVNTNFHHRGVEIDHDEEAVNFMNLARPNSVRDQKRRGHHESSDSEEEEEREERGLALAGEIRRFADRVVRTEERKMEMMRETERYRIEMEKRTTEMIRESQKKVMDIIAKAFGTKNNKKMKMEMD